MNKREVILKVSVESGVNAADCEKVLNAFENVFTHEISASNTASTIFDKAYRMLNYIQSKRNCN